MPLWNHIHLTIDVLERPKPYLSLSLKQNKSKTPYPNKDTMAFYTSPIANQQIHIFKTEEMLGKNGNCCCGSPSG